MKWGSAAASIQEWSRVKPVAQRTASTASVVSSAKRTVAWLAATARGCSVTPAAAGAARAAADEDVSVAQTAAERRPGGHAHHAAVVQDVEDVAAEQVLREWRLARADGEMDVVGRRQLLRELEAGVAATDHEDASFRQVVRRAVVGAVHVRDGEAVGEGGAARDLERTGRDDDVGGAEAAAFKLELVAAVGGPQRVDPAVELHGQLEVAGVVGEVGDDLVPAGVVGRRGGERQAGEAVVARGGEQAQRVPAFAPCRRRRRRGVEDREALPALREVVADGEARLPGADHDHLVLAHTSMVPHRGITTGYRQEGLDKTGGDHERHRIRSHQPRDRGDAEDVRRHQRRRFEGRDRPGP